MTAPRSEFRKAVARVVRRRWQGLEDDPGTRANLRRAGCIADVFGVPGFHHDLLRPAEEILGRELGDFEAERLAVVAAVLSHVTKDTGGRTPGDFGRYLGNPVSRNQPRISGLRFRRLLSIRDLETLLRTMIRVVRLLQKACPVIALAEVLTGWGSDVTRRELAMEYYAAAPKAA